ncbi:MAG: VanW family protein [Filifactor alocis]|nr:VanW family protein [Filifactor alocis]
MKKLAAVLIVLALIVLGTTGYFYNYMKKDIVYDNVSVNQIPLEGLNKQQAKNLLLEREQYKTITFLYEDKEYKYELKEFGYVMDYDSAVESAYAVARTGNFFKDMQKLIQLKFLGDGVDIPLSRQENLAALTEKVKEINSQNYLEPRNATISIKNNYAIQKEVVGRKVQLDEVEALITQALKPNEEVVVTLPVKKIVPKITEENLKRINGKIGQFSTRFNASISGRVENIRVATKSIDSTVLLPGEEFSFNKITGDRGLADGYKEASVIINGKYEKGVAGGVCQVSTTLYNAALYAGLDITRRRPHSIPTGYVDIGRDAAVVSGEFDLRFKNPYDYPIVLQGHVSGNHVVFQVYGDVNSHKAVHLKSETVSRVPKKIIYKKDPTLPQGKQVVEEPGRDEIRSVTYMTINGETKIINRDRYPAKAEIVRIGTGAPEVKPNDATGQSGQPAPGVQPNANQVPPETHDITG